MHKIGFGKLFIRYMLISIASGLVVFYVLSH